jgi:hypothetical protein
VERDRVDGVWGSTMDALAISGVSPTYSCERLQGMRLTAVDASPQRGADVRVSGANARVQFSFSCEVTQDLPAFAR